MSNLLVVITDARTNDLHQEQFSKSSKLADVLLPPHRHQAMNLKGLLRLGFSVLVRD
ncbi:hypothetical protein IQ249_11715 [Lusitaniella coriacea LEGE 07157]|uniref:Uncharacterized protein n=1 Tax=Lusitaniella coriacea LEGE 07157 TaxID=945747 RepID=A0A8J7IT25_9CYAN|nr:hypothetical protein [Lusitaniella coriacea LEGE 07157]